MKKIKVVRLSGCEWCRRLVTKLEELNIKFDSINAESDGKLADSLEDLLNTTYYPIVLLESPEQTYYLFRPSDEKRLGKRKINDQSTAVGCFTLDSMLSEVVSYLN